MNIQLLPDLAAMATLLTILYFLRRRHRQEDVGLWITGMLFIFLEAIAHVFYMSSGPRHIPAHVVALDSYLAAGMIFLWAASKSLFPRRAALTYLLINAVPFAAVQTIYALDVRKAGPYRMIAACGLVLGLMAPFLAARSLKIGKAWWLVALQFGVWGLVWTFGSTAMYRDAVYIPLFVIYFTVAVLFQFSLPRKSLGKVAIVMGFAVWALVFLLHSWVSNRPEYIPVAAEVWDWQKFLVTIGMLLVMLERQVTSNEWLALHDQLTGLPNRRRFEERLARSIRHSQGNGTRTAVMMIDLDGFKAINDSQGHDTGDLLLQQIAHGLRHAIRSGDTLARLGGDEFIIVAGDLPIDTPVAQIVKACTARIDEALRKPFTIAGQKLAVSGSVGVAVFPDDAADEVLLRRLADQRMYEQKRGTALLAESPS
ncbi:MAG: GGDEF domain-containing protein [Acidobacteria bacterium]|nr:GGDEF domain-containing protein [Acidobacteriota bacterium]